MKRLALLLILWASPALADVAYDAVSSGAGTNVSSLSWDHTVTGSNTVLYCGAAVNGSGAPTGMTYNSAAMTEISSATVGGFYVRVYRKIAPTTSTNSVAITLSGNGDFAVGCISVTGANQSAPEGTIVTDAHTTTPLEAGLTIAANGMGLSFGFDKETASCTAHTSTNDERYDLCDSGPEIGAFGSTTTSTGSVTMGWTGMAGNYKGIVGVPVLAQTAVASTGLRKVIVVE
jgi:hypothetical protein